MRGALVLLLAFSGTGWAQSPATGAHDSWSYHGATGPANWGHLKKAYAVCSNGREQSPIDLPATTSSHLPALRLDYRAATARIVNNGHTVQANFSGSERLFVGDDVYRLTQLHYHSPSEHEVNGVASPLEVHLVHADAKGHLAVVGVLFDEGKVPNAAIAALLAGVGASHSLDPALLLPADHAYVTYAGSLTTPPCSEGVRWLVMEQHVTASAAQIAALRKIIADNARPIQPLNGRAVK